MPEENLDGAQVRTCFQEMGCEAVPQRVRMDVLMLKTRAERRLPARRPEHLGGDRAAGRMPPVAGKQPYCRLAQEYSPVGAQRFEQGRTQHHVAVLAALAAADMNHHPLAVDVADLQSSHFGPACSRGIERHDQDALKGRLGRIDQTSYFRLTEDLWQMQFLLRLGCLGDAPASLQHLDIQKPQCGKPLCDRVRGPLPGAEHRSLVLPDMIGAKPVRRTTEVLSECSTVRM